MSHHRDDDNPVAPPPKVVVLEDGKGHGEPWDVPVTRTLSEDAAAASRRGEEQDRSAVVKRPRDLKTAPFSARTIDDDDADADRHRSRVLVESSASAAAVAYVPQEDNAGKDSRKRVLAEGPALGERSSKKIIDAKLPALERAGASLSSAIDVDADNNDVDPRAGASLSSAIDVDTEDDDDDDGVDPTTVDDTPWIYQYGGMPFRDEKALGKWLVFEGASRIAQTWRAIRQAVASSTIPSMAAKVSTRRQQQASNKSHVICVYSSADRINEVAYALISIVRRNISFKTDEATASNLYSYNTNAPVTIKTLYWRNGRPTFTKPPKPMMPKQSLALAVQIVSQARKNNTTLSLDYSFDIVVTCSGIQHKIPSISQRRKVLMEGVTELALLREPDNEFDKYAIRVELKNDTGDSNSTTTTTLKPNQVLVVGYVTSLIQPHYARLLAPFVDRHLLTIDSAHCLRWVNEDSTVLDMAVSGRAVPQAQPLLETL